MGISNVKKYLRKWPRFTCGKTSQNEYTVPRTFSRYQHYFHIYIFLKTDNVLAKFISENLEQQFETISQKY